MLKPHITKVNCFHFHGVLNPKSENINSPTLNGTNEPGSIIYFIRFEPEMFIQSKLNPYLEPWKKDDEKSFKDNIILYLQ